MKKYIRKLAICLCAIVFVYSVYQLGVIFYNYYTIDRDNNSLIEEVIDVEEEDDDEIEEVKPFDPKSMSIDFDKLLKKNKDVVGWLVVPNTKINDVLLLGETNDTYIKTTIDGKSSSAGSLFLDCDNHGDFKDNNTIIYGHNMKNGSRFHNVRYYVNKDKDYFNNHNKAYIYLPDGTINEYEIFASATINERSSLYTNPSSYKDYVKEVLSNAKYKNEVSDEEAPIIMLSTCHSSIEDQRYVVFARLVGNIK